MRFLYIYLLIHCFSIIGNAQDVVNPFEIQSRLDSIYQSDHQIESSENNIFDVEGRTPVSNTPSSTIVSPINEQVEEESSITPSVGDETEGENVIQDTDIDINPFDVSHIPIRKSKLKKEADAFKAKNKTTERIGANDRNTEKSGSNAFLFWLNLLTGLILAIVINTQRGALTKIAKSITNENVLKLNHREEKKGLNGHYLLLYLSYFINAAIFIYLILYNIKGISGWSNFQLSLLIVVGIYLVRHVFLFAVSKIFPIEKEVSLYGFTIQSFNLFIGIILIPINLLIAFGPENIAVPLIYITLIVLLIILVLRSIRGLLIVSRYVSSNLFHFFLYLCAFEILPILLLIKVLGNF